MKIGLIVLMLLGAFSVGAEEIVVLTETKVLEFTLPDGSVLTNAYAWRTDSRGIMIMHDGELFPELSVAPRGVEAGLFASGRCSRRAGAGIGKARGARGGVARPL